MVTRNQYVTTHLPNHLSAHSQHYTTRPDDGHGEGDGHERVAAERQHNVMCIVQGWCGFTRVLCSKQATTSPRAARAVEVRGAVVARKNRAKFYVCSLKWLASS